MLGGFEVAGDGVPVPNGAGSGGRRDSREFLPWPRAVGCTASRSSTRSGPGRPSRLPPRLAQGRPLRPARARRRARSPPRNDGGPGRPDVTRGRRDRFERLARQAMTPGRRRSEYGSGLWGGPAAGRRLRAMDRGESRVALRMLHLDLLRLAGPWSDLLRRNRPMNRPTSRWRASRDRARYGLRCVSSSGWTRPCGTSWARCRVEARQLRAELEAARAGAAPTGRPRQRKPAIRGSNGSDGIRPRGCSAAPTSATRRTADG